VACGAALTERTQFMHDHPIRAVLTERSQFCHRIVDRLHDNAIVQKCRSHSLSELSSVKAKKPLRHRSGLTVAALLHAKRQSFPLMVSLGHQYLGTIHNL